MGIELPCALMREQQAVLDGTPFVRARIDFRSAQSDVLVVLQMARWVAFGWLLKLSASGNDPQQRWRFALNPDPDALDDQGQRCLVTLTKSNTTMIMARLVA